MEIIAWDYEGGGIIGNPKERGFSKNIDVAFANKKIYKRYVYESFEAWYKKRKFRGSIPCMSDFCKDLKYCCNLQTNWRFSLGKNTNLERKYHIAFPSLKDMRDSFRERFGRGRWQFKIL